MVRNFRIEFLRNAAASYNREAASPSPYSVGIRVTATTGSVFTISGFQTRRLSGKHRAQHFSSTRDTKCVAKWRGDISIIRCLGRCFRFRYRSLLYVTTLVVGFVLILECSNYVARETRQLCKNKLRPILQGSRYISILLSSLVYYTRRERGKRERKR